MDIVIGGYTVTARFTKSKTLVFMELVCCIGAVHICALIRSSSFNEEDGVVRGFYGTKVWWSTFKGNNVRSLSRDDGPAKEAGLAG